MTTGCVTVQNIVEVFVGNPTIPGTLYAGTDGGGVFESVDGDANGQVTIDELLALVNIALGNAAAMTCGAGIDRGVGVDVTWIIQAVDDAMGRCGRA